MTQRDDLLAAIRAIEAQRDLLGEEAVEAATAPLRARVAELGKQEAERKQITVMFADLSGFTALSETADAEDVRNLVNACFERLGAVATRRGGHIDKFIGDEMMVLFGAPRAMEDHASRALIAALEMREALAAFSAEHASEMTKPLGMHFGINSGLVVAGGMGLQGKREYTVMGDSVNVAARLASLAPTGAIFVGEGCRRLVGPGFEFSPKGALALDGRGRPVEVFELAAVRAAADTKPGPFAESAFLGRARELESLQKALNNVIEEKCPRTIGVIGPAGIGKSRLLAEFQKWAAAEHPEVRVRIGSGLPHAAMTPYSLVADLIRRSLGIRESDGSAEIRSRLDLRLPQLGIEDSEPRDALATILALEPDANRSPALDPPDTRSRVSRAVAKVLRSMAAVSPAVLAFEDLHWADAQSINLLNDLRNELGNAPVLFVALTRPVAEGEERTRQAEKALLSVADVRLALQELREDDCVELVRSLAPGIDASPGAIETIVRKGQGNPFFIQAIIGTLLDQGVLVRGADGSSTTVRGTLDEVSVPDTVWGVLAERIDRLATDQKRALQMAAIIGQVFWKDLVADLAGVPAIEARLRRLEEQGFIESVGPAAFEGDWEWSFRHALVQDVAYAGMLRSLRKEAHLRVGAWLAERAGERLHELAPLLAYHFERGEDWQRTAEFAEAAGDRATQLFANREAVAAYQQGVAALAKLPPDPVIQRRLVELAIKLAKVGLGTPTAEILPVLQRAKALAAELADDSLAQRVWSATSTWLFLARAGRRVSV